MNNALELFLNERKIDYRTNVEYASINSLHIGGPLRYLVEVGNEADAVALYRFLHQQRIPHSIIGEGKYLLVSDKGYDGVAIKLTGEFAAFAINGRTIIAGGAALIERIAREARVAGLGGLEFASDLPGSIGGAILKNATAFGRSISDVLHRLRIITPDGVVADIEDTEMAFDENGLIRNDSIIIGATFMLDDMPEVDVTRLSEKYRHIRSRLLPVTASTGLIFRDPPGDKKAHEMIERVGADKLEINAVKWFTLNPNYILVGKNASATDVYHLIMETQKRVHQHYGVSLEISVGLLGVFD